MHLCRHIFSIEYCNQRNKHIKVKKMKDFNEQIDQKYAKTLTYDLVHLIRAECLELSGKGRMCVYTSLSVQSSLSR